MLEYLINIDKAVFRFFNTAIANPLFDFIMPIITNQNIWVIPILVTILFLLVKGGRRGQITAVILIVSVGLADATSAQILKPFFGRLRPSHELTEGIRILMGKGGKFGFVSSHAANIFAAAVVFNYFYPRYSQERLCFLLIVYVINVDFLPNRNGNNYGELNSLLSWCTHL